MYLKSHRTYSNDRSDLKLRILKVQYRGTRYTKVKGLLMNKKNGIIYEKKNYKLYHKLVHDWKEIE